MTNLQGEFDFSVVAPEVPSIAEQVVWTDKDIEKLMDGLIHDAIRSLRDSRISTESFSKDAAWLFSENEKSFSARNCCLVSGLDLDELRLGLYRTLGGDRRDKVRAIWDMVCPGYRKAIM